MLNYTQLSDEMRYQWELSHFSDDYQTTLRLFQTYLKKHDKIYNFVKSLREYRKGQTTLEFVAMDWSIPVCMVKYYLNILSGTI